MRWSGCSREEEVQGLLHSGQWPAACSSEVREHVDACSTCGDLVLLTSIFERVRTESAKAPRLESPGVLWWRAHLRRRAAALERIAKPVAGAQLFALLINLLLAVVFLAVRSRHGIHWLSWMSGLVPSYPLETLWSISSMKPGWNFMLLISGAGAIALLSGVVLYLSSDRD